MIPPHLCYSSALNLLVLPVVPVLASSVAAAVVPWLAGSLRARALDRFLYALCLIVSGSLDLETIFVM